MQEKQLIFITFYKFFILILNKKSKSPPKTINYYMTYNDFPTLSDDQFKILNEQYFKIKQDRKTILNSTCLILNSTIYSCFQLDNKYNQQLEKIITETNNYLRLILENLTTLFNISTHNKIEINNFNIFYYINNLSSISKLLIEWIKCEENEYYKTVAHKSVLTVLDYISKLSSALTQCNTIIFKHM